MGPAHADLWPPASCNAPAQESIGYKLSPHPARRACGRRVYRSLGQQRADSRHRCPTYGDSMLGDTPPRFQSVTIPQPAAGMTVKLDLFLRAGRLDRPGRFRVVPTTLGEVNATGMASREVLKSQAVALQSHCSMTISSPRSAGARIQNCPVQAGGE